MAITGEEGILGNSLLEKRHRLGSLNREAIDQLNKTHHFNMDSKMSIQLGVVKKGEDFSLTQLNQASEMKDQPSHAISTARPFDKQQNQSKFASPLAPDKVQLNRTIQHEGSSINPDDLYVRKQQLMFVDVQTPEQANAMERIRSKIEEKKQEKLQRKRNQEQLVEKAREQVLGNYNIRTFN